ncbi:hypothetical protein [Nostoc sp.]|uniref:hypothetical protein n=1 Tax=Nostoc sp. TaxID=1180 RepID=UPI002FFA08C9
MTSQIEKEFLKNRIRTINKDFFSPLKSIQSDFQSTYDDIKNKLKSFLESKKNTLSKDYPDIWNLLSEKQQKLNEILEDEQTVSEKLSQAIETTTTDYKNIYVVDKLLQICSELKITPALDNAKVDFIQKQYDALWQVYDAEKDNTKRREISFPGCGDKRDIAIGIEKVVYSFNGKTQPILKSTISRIDKDKGFGFISAQPEYLYFHSTFLEDFKILNNLEVDSSVEYVVGKNELGEDIARLVRVVSPSQN